MNGGNALVVCFQRNKRIEFSGPTIFSIFWGKNALTKMHFGKFSLIRYSHTMSPRFSSSGFLILFRSYCYEILNHEKWNRVLPQLVRSIYAKYPRTFVRWLVNFSTRKHDGKKWYFYCFQWAALQLGLNGHSFFTKFLAHL